jgi:hypothetical protein
MRKHIISRPHHLGTPHHTPLIVILLMSLTSSATSSASTQPLNLLQRLANHHTLELNMRFLEPLMAISFVLLASASPLANLTKRSPPEQADPGHRRGIAYNDPNLVKYFDVKDAQLGWCYNWYSQPGNNNWAHEYVPMLWSNSQSLTGNWNDAVSQAVNIYPDKPTHLMAFNEPDNCA